LSPPLPSVSRPNRLEPARIPILSIVSTDIRADFQAAIAGPDAAVDLFRGAMLIARLRGGTVEPDAVARELDLISQAVRDQSGQCDDADSLAHAIDHHLFAVLGFHGSPTPGDDPENSYLDMVVARRAGTPLTLSLVYMEVARRVGLVCEGIGYPGHFIVRCSTAGGPIYVDPFNQGARLDRGELLAGLRGQRLGATVPDAYLAAVTRRQILQQLLHDLRTIFRDNRDIARWLAAVELALAIEPWNADLVGQRGMLLYRLGRPAEALEDLERYVEAGQRDTVNPGALRLLDELRVRYRGTEEVL
jgi:regulator of sirC expression with transglutaminase-like and TPR domain